MKLGPPILGLAVYWLLWPGLRVFLKRSKRTRALIMVNDEIVVTKSWLGNGKWSLPGGGIKPHETEQAAIIREVDEEIGLRVSPAQIKKLANKTYRHNGLEFPFALFKVALPKKITLRPSRSEVVESRWIKTSDLNTRNASSDVLQALADYIR